MQHSNIGFATRDVYSNTYIFYNGKDQELTAETRELGNPPSVEGSGIFPTSLLDALEKLDEIASHHNRINRNYNFRVCAFDREALHTDEERGEKLRAESQRRAAFAGVPTIMGVIKTLEHLVAQDKDIVPYPVYCCGCECFLHPDAGRLEIIIDNELLYEDYELNE